MGKKNKIYRDHEIQPIEYQQTICYRIKSPAGVTWTEIVANIKTAKKWIDIAIH